MGIHVCLSALPKRIDARAWERAYGETVELLRAWPDPPLGIQWRIIAEQRLVVYTRDFEHEKGWRVVGDARTRRRSESFEFPRVLRGASEHPELDAGDDTDDVLVAHVRMDDCARVFGEKTQGEPYHHMLVAVGLLIENRFPRAALVHGEIDRSDGERARDALGKHFGERFELPVVTDPVRARARLDGRVAEGAIDELLAYHSSLPSNAFVGDLLAILARSSARSRLLKDLEENAPSCTDPASLGPEARQAFLDLGAKLGELARGFELEARLAAGERDRTRLLTEIAAATAQSGRRLTEMAWEEIERSPEAELRLLWVLAHMTDTELVLSLMVRALFESRALRLFALQRFV